MEALVRGMQVTGSITALAIVGVFGHAAWEALRARPRSPAWRLIFSIVLGWIGAGIVFSRASVAYLLQGHIGIWQTELVWRLLFLACFLTSGALAIAERWHGRYGVVAFFGWSLLMGVVLALLVAADLQGAP
jgi:hypothetical protein